MPGSVKLMMRLITIRPPTPLCMMGIWRERISTAAAPISPKTAPDAPTVNECGVTISAPSEAAEQRSFFEHAVAGAAGEREVALGDEGGDVDDDQHERDLGLARCAAQR